MPTYDFTCPEGHETEKFYRSIAAAPAEIPCPVCGEPAVRQVSGGAGLLFKGSGFYITDYGKDGKKDLKSAKPSTSTGEAAGGSKGADSSAPTTPSPAPSSTPPKSTE